MYSDSLSNLLSRDEYQNLILELDDLVAAFSKKAHLKNCKSPIGNPLKHPKCRKRFGLHTAIVDQIALITALTLVAKTTDLRLSDIGRIRDILIFSWNVLYSQKEKYSGHFLLVGSWKDKISKRYGELVERLKNKQNQESKRNV